MSLPALRVIADRLPPVTHINLRLLQTFMLVAETLSFREAAERTRRSQSAVSIQIKQLEEQLGLKLLYRTTRTVRLTDEGAELYKGTRRAMDEVQLGLRRIRESTDIRRGNVSLGCSPSAAASLLPRVLAVFETDYPDVLVHLRELHSHDLFQAVRAGEVDFGIGPRVAGVGEDIAFEVMFSDPFVALVHRSLAPGNRNHITLAELGAMPVLMQDTSSVTRGQLEEALRRAGVRLNGKYDCMQAQTLVAMAEAGLGAAVVPRSILRSLHAPSTRALRIDGARLVRDISLVTLRGKPLSATAQRLAQRVRECSEP